MSILDGALITAVVVVLVITFFILAAGEDPSE